MSGMSIPSNFGGFGGASTMGYTGGSFNPNTTAAVTNAAGKLEAFDPTTMAETRAPTPTAPEPEVLGGFNNSGLPTWQTNWLQNGGQGTLKPPEAGVTGANQSSVAGKVIRPAVVPPPTTKIGTGKQTGSGGYGGASATPATTTTTAATAPKLTMVPQQNNYQQPLYVNDQWNFQAGTSMPVATPALGQGGPNSGGGQMPIFTDGKGNFFFDQAGTKAVPAGAAQQFKMMMQTQGHL